MGWDSSAEPEFQAKLDGVEQFCREEAEALYFVFPYAVRLSDSNLRPECVEAGDRRR
jgi:acyl-CoA dehydrogenase